MNKPLVTHGPRHPQGMQQGFLLFEIIVVVGILSAIIMNSFSLSEDTQRKARAASFTNWFQVHEKAAQLYLDAYSTELYEEVKDGGYAEITDTASSVFTGAHAGADGLSQFLTGMIGKNHFDQDIRLFVYRNPDGAGVHGLLTTDGGWPGREGMSGGDKAIREDINTYMQAATIVSTLTNAGIMGKRVNGYMTQDGTIHGVRDAWTLKPADFGLPAPAPGQLAKGLYSATGTVRDDTLYREAIEGHDELNAMNTDLHMNGYTIDNAGTIIISNNPHIVGASGELAPVEGLGNGLVLDPVRSLITYDAGNRQIAETAQNVCDNDGDPKPDGFLFTVNAAADNGADFRDANGLYMCMGGNARQMADSGNGSAIKDISVVVSQAVIQKPVCPAGSIPQIFVVPNMFARSKEAPPVMALQAYVDDIPGSSSWKVRIRLKTTKEKNNDWLEEGLNLPPSADGKDFPNWNRNGTLEKAYTTGIAFSTCTRIEGLKATDSAYPNNIRTFYSTAAGDPTNWQADGR